jgi:hypothetical protein
MIGTTNMGAANPAEAMERVDVVRMAELWVWDDHAVRICDTCQHPEHDLRHRKDLPLYQHNFKWQGGTAGDYRKATLVVSSGYEPVLWEPINPLIPEEHPFHDLTLDPVYGYIWGLSRIDELYPLQAWREQRMTQIDLLMQKQVNPPKVGIGVAGTFEEKMARLDRPGANVAFPQSGNTDVKPFTIPMPPDAFAEIDKIDEMFDKAAGRRSRQRQPGMRSGDQVMAEARLAGGPSRNKAMIVEKAAESVATHLLRLQHRCLKRPLVTAKGQEFLLYHIPADFVVKVEGHSASPLYQEEQMSKIAFAASKKWIDADEGIELLNMPNVQVLRAKARRRQAAEAEAQSGLLEAKKHEAESKSIKNLATAKAQRDKVG